MRSFVLVFGVVATAAFGGNANAQNYPWCAYYGGGDIGGGGTRADFGWVESGFPGGL
jgi:hypothetical protein